VFVYDCRDATGGHQAGHVVNPVLAAPAVFARPVTEPEACLSLPGQQADITRPALAAVAGTDM
jgi:peptide deformylase